MNFVRMKMKHPGLAVGDVGPEECESPAGIVTEEAFGVEGAAVDVTGEVADGGLAFSDGLELDVVDFVAHVEVGGLAFLVFAMRRMAHPRA
jgi:hypothetical protein